MFDIFAANIQENKLCNRSSDEKSLGLLVPRQVKQKLLLFGFLSDATHTVTVSCCFVSAAVAATEGRLSDATCWKRSHLEDVLLSGQRVGLSSDVEGDGGERWDLITAHHVLKHKPSPHEQNITFILYIITKSLCKIFSPLPG